MLERLSRSVTSNQAKYLLARLGALTMEHGFIGTGSGLARTSTNLFEDVHFKELRCSADSVER
jgi:hypothetical protein